MKGISEFQSLVYNIYHNIPREEEMPWREEYSPYHVLLSEFMLQQTQVVRAREHFNTFVHLWPSIEELAVASLQDVLYHWQGLGYNRRAKFLHESAKLIVSKYGGQLPRDKTALLQLPGIGEYTSSAIMVFAFNEPTIVVETNIRRVFIHHFFSDRDNITEKELAKKVEIYMDRDQPREWYWALMDYGAFLAKRIANPNVRSRVYRKQSEFKGSDRQIRGVILRVMLRTNEGDMLNKEEIVQRVLEDMRASGSIAYFEKDVLEDKIKSIILALESENFLCKHEVKDVLFTAAEPTVSYSVSR